MLAVLAPLCLCAVVMAVPRPSNLMERMLGAEMIIGGKTLSIKNAKWAVEVVTTLPSGMDGTPHYDICGGSLIKVTHVLTAGHCVPDKVDAANIGALALYIGTSFNKDTKESGVKMLAETFKRHPKFKNVEDDEGTTPIFDVAVIRLKEAVTPGATIAVIAITKAHAEPRTGSKLDIAGWGVTSRDSQNPSRELRVGTYVVESRDACKKEFGKKFNNQEICIASNPKATFCSGDSGSSAVQGHVQYGVVSWGSCGDVDKGSGVLANLAEPSINAFIVEMLAKL